MAEPGQPPLDSADLPPYFNDALLDRFAAALVETLGKVWVLQDRVLVLEALLTRQGILTQEQLDRYQPTPEEAVRRRTERDALIRAVLDRLALG